MRIPLLICISNQKQLHQLVADKDSPGKSGSSPDIQHLVDIVPWLFLQAQNESLLREALLIPQVFMVGKLACISLNSLIAGLILLVNKLFAISIFNSMSWWPVLC